MAIINRLLEKTEAYLVTEHQEEPLAKAHSEEICSLCPFFYPQCAIAGMVLSCCCEYK
jgi:hypothetical protein